MFKFLAATALVIALALGDDESTKPEVMKNPLLLSRSRRIVNGTEATTGTIPWQVALLELTKTNVRALCGGCIVSSRWVLTTAHCIFHFNKTRRPFVDLVSSGSANWLYGSLHHIIDKIHHPSYEYRAKYESMINDIGLIRIAEPFVFDASRKPVELYDQDAGTLDEFRVIASGWGSTRADSLEYPDVLRFVELEILRRTDCERFLKWHYNGTTTIPGGEICGKNIGNGIACFGDSGSPIVINNRTVVGIVSWARGNGCAIPNNPLIFTEIYHHRNWTLTTMSAWKYRPELTSTSSL